VKISPYTGGVRVALTSDLHVDHHPEVAELVAARLTALSPDVAVVAGDLSHDPAAVERTLARLARAVPVLAFLPGNHDLWCEKTGPQSRERYLEILPEACRRAGVHPLSDGPLTVGGVAFVGETGWFDYTLRNRALDATFTLDDYRKGAWGRFRWNDKLHVRFAGDGGEGFLDDEAIAAWMAARLAKKLADTTLPTVAVTHHLPFQELAFVRGEPPWDFLNGFIGSARLGEAIAACPRVVAALAGHTHLRRTAIVDGAGGSIRCEVSPVGYPREYRSRGTLADRVADRVTVLEIAGTHATLDAPLALCNNDRSA
jgi:hypothetical protein